MVRDVVLFPRNTFYSLYGSQIVKSVPDFPCFTFLQVTFAFQAGFSEVVSTILVLSHHLLVHMCSGNTASLLQ